MFSFYWVEIFQLLSSHGVLLLVSSDPVRPFLTWRPTWIFSICCQVASINYFCLFSSEISLVSSIILQNVAFLSTPYLSIQPTLPVAHWGYLPGAVAFCRLGLTSQSAETELLSMFSSIHAFKSGDPWMDHPWKKNIPKRGPHRQDVDRIYM